MKELGIMNGRHLKNYSREKLKILFGKAGEYYYKIAHCEDDRPVSPDRIRKSIGKEVTFGEDITDVELMIEYLKEIISQLTQMMQKYDIMGRTITLKIKYFDFNQVTRSVSLGHPIDAFDVILEHVVMLLRNTEAGDKKVRLLGVTLSNLNIEEDDESSSDCQLIFEF